MPKQRLNISDFSGGMNSRKDPRDLGVNEFSFIQNMSVDALGKIKTLGSMYAHIEDQDGDTDLSEYLVERTSNLVGAGGYGLFYFESDHSRVSKYSITDTKHPATSDDLEIGAADGDITFHQVESSADSGGKFIQS